MYELKKAAGNTYYIEAPAKIGVYKNCGSAVLIDSGNDAEAGKKILKILEGAGLRLNYIINTHSNADHIGGNAYLLEKTGCRIYACGSENAFIKNTMLEPSFLYGGYPFKALRNKFLAAVPSVSEDINLAPLPEGFSVIPLKGHFFDMIGVLTADNVFFIADSLVGENILNKYHISFIYDVREYMNTLDFLEKFEADMFVPSHAEAAGDIIPLVRANRNKINEIAELLLNICSRPVNFENILALVFEKYGIRMDFNQYVLAGSTIRSYLSYLSDMGEIEAFCEKSMLLWKR